MGIVVLGKMPETVSSNVELSLPDGGKGTLPITFKMRSRKQMAEFEDGVAKKMNCLLKPNVTGKTIYFVASNSSPCVITPKAEQDGNLYLGSVAQIKSCSWALLKGSFVALKPIENGCYELTGIDTTNTKECPPEACDMTFVAHDGKEDQRTMSDLMDAQAEILMTVIAGWGIESKFEKDSVLQLINEIPSSVSEILARYREVMRGERRKN